MKLPEVREIDRHSIEDSVKLHGMEAQCDVLVEECAELIVALQKLKRKRGKTTEEKIKDVQDELADVFLMSNQGAYMFGVDAVQERINFKMERLVIRNNEKIQ